MLTRHQEDVCSSVKNTIAGEISGSLYTMKDAPDDKFKCLETEVQKEFSQCVKKIP